MYSKYYLCIIEIFLNVYSTVYCIKYFFGNMKYTEKCSVTENLFK